MVFVAYESLKAPGDVSGFVKARGRDAEAVRGEIARVVAGSRREWSFFG